MGESVSAANWANDLARTSQLCAPTLCASVVDWRPFWRLGQGSAEFQSLESSGMASTVAMQHFSLRSFSLPRVARFGITLIGEKTVVLVLELQVTLSDVRRE